MRKLLCLLMAAALCLPLAALAEEWVVTDEEELLPTSEPLPMLDLTRDWHILAMDAEICLEEDDQGGPVAQSLLAERFYDNYPEGVLRPFSDDLALALVAAADGPHPEGLMRREAEAKVLRHYVAYVTGRNDYADGMLTAPWTGEPIACEIGHDWLAFIYPDGFSTWGLLHELADGMIEWRCEGELPRKDGLVAGWVIFVRADLLP